jgi:hypothetical protein
VRTEKSGELRERVSDFAAGCGTDRETLIWLGERLDQRLPTGGTLRELMAKSLLKIRDKEGKICELELNAAQRRFESDCGKRNLILKARQLGMTTWVAARFLINTITRPGTLSVQVAHDQDSAEQIFRTFALKWHGWLETAMKGRCTNWNSASSGKRFRCTGWAA